MPKYYTVNLNTVRNVSASLSNEQRIAEATGSVKLLLVPRGADQLISEGMIPDYLVTDDMVTRFLEISPPFAAVIPEFQEVIIEIEKAYVRGEFFSAVSAACVSIERLLNLARIELRKYHQFKKALWNKGPLDNWAGSIEPLQHWGYLDKGFAEELADMYKSVRCKYLHSGDLSTMPDDARRSVHAAYKLLKIFLGFPEELFDFTTGINCKDENDPRFKAFYLPNIHEGTSGAT